MRHRVVRDALGLARQVVAVQVGRERAVVAAELMQLRCPCAAELRKAVDEPDRLAEVSGVALDHGMRLNLQSVRRLVA